MTPEPPQRQVWHCYEGAKVVRPCDPRPKGRLLYWCFEGGPWQPVDPANVAVIAGRATIERYAEARKER